MANRSNVISQELVDCIARLSWAFGKEQETGLILELPAALGPALPKRVALAANLAANPNRAEPFAYWVDQDSDASSAMPEDPSCVFESELASLRRNGVLIVGRDTGKASLTSFFRNFWEPDFASGESKNASVVGLHAIASDLTYSVIKPRLPVAVGDTVLGEINASALIALTRGRDLILESGNREDPWTTVFWRWLSQSFHFAARVAEKADWVNEDGWKLPFAACGLPWPIEKDRYRPKFTPKVHLDHLTKSWQDASSIRERLERLESKLGSPIDGLRAAFADSELLAESQLRWRACPVSTVSWNGRDSEGAEDRVECWLPVDEDTFVQAHSAADDPKVHVELLVDDRWLEAPELPDGVVVIPFCSEGSLEGRPAVSLRIRLASAAPIISVDSDASGWSFQPQEFEAPAPGESRGFITRLRQESTDHFDEETPLVADYTTTDGVKQVSFRILATKPARDYMILSRTRGKSNPEIFSCNPGEHVEQELPSGFRRAEVLAIANGKPPRRLSAQPEGMIPGARAHPTAFPGFSCSLDRGLHLKVDDSTFSLAAPEFIPEESPPRSPIIDLAEGKEHSLSPVDSTHPFLALEKWLAAEYLSITKGESSWSDPSHLFHIQLPESDGSLGFDCASLRLADGRFSSSRLRRQTPNNRFLFPSPDLLDSQQAGHLREAYLALGLGDLLETTAEACAGDGLLSRADLRGRKDGIDRLLEAYVDLISFADTRLDESAYDRSWARIPFSFSILNQQGDVLGVLLSPFHPLRLARAAWIQDRVEGAPNTKLVSFVEGWAFPFLVQAPTAHSDPSDIEGLLALPMDTGEGSLFSNWSALTRITRSQDKLQFPATMAGLPLPGLSSTGLSEGAVRNAVSDYKRLFPQASSLTLAITNGSGNRRNSSLDRAIHEASTNYRSEGSGIHVFDDSRRKGSPPRPASSLGEDSKRPSLYTWRVAGEEEKAKPADIRFIEDLGLRTKFQDYDPCTSFDHPATPLRRFLVRDVDNHKRVVIRAPRIDPQQNDCAFFRALDAAETLQSRDETGSSKAGSVVASIDPAAFQGTSDRWTVLGDLFIDPTTINPMLEGPAGSANQEQPILWEWRPANMPYSSKDQQTQTMDRRPFLAMSAIPPSLVKAIKGQLEEAGIRGLSGREILKSLGTHGIGLNSLFAIGHHQAAGALGFYFAFKCLQNIFARPSGAHSHERLDLILPIDGADRLISQLIDQAPLDSQRRADLLYLRYDAVNPTVLQIVPIEIKNYGPRSNFFPAVGASRLNDPLEQLESTRRQIAKLEGEQTSHPLHAIAYASLVEAAALVSNLPINASALLSKAIDNICHSRISTIVRPGILLYFQNHAADQQTGQSWSVHSGGGSAPILAFASPSAQPWSSQGDGDESDFTRSLRAEIDRMTSPHNQQAGSMASAAIPEDPDPLPSQQGSPGGDTSAGREFSNRESQHPASEPLGTRDTSPIDQPRQDGRHVASDSSLPGMQILLGRDSTSAPLRWSPFRQGDHLPNAHCVIVGASGSGKTYTIERIMAPQVVEAGAKVFVLEFNDEFADFTTEDCRRLNVAMDGIDFNPLAIEPEGGRAITVIKHAYALNGILRSTFGLGVQQANATLDAIIEYYADLGLEKNAVISEGGRSWPVFTTLERFVENQPSPATLLGRIRPLFDMAPFRGERGTIQDLLSRSSIMALKDMPDDSSRAAVSSILLRGAYQTLSLQGECHGQLRNVVIIDEAHKVANSKEVETLIREIRKFGGGVWLSSQEPGDFDETVWQNCESKIIMKINDVGMADKCSKVLCSTKALSQELRELGRGEAFIQNTHWAPYKRIDMNRGSP